MNPRLLEIEKEERELLERLLALSREKEELRARDVRIDEGHNEEPEPPPDFSIFKPTTCRLLTVMYEAPDRMLYRDDIRQEVMEDEYASEKAVWNVVDRAREEIAEYNIEIKTIHGKGYQLIADK